MNYCIKRSKRFHVPTDKVIILGDFNENERVGDDFTSWPIALGKFGRDIRITKCLVGKKADELQQLADRNSSKGFFAAIEQVYDTENCCCAN